MNILFINYGELYGGQERVLSLLIKKIEEKSRYKCFFYGTPLSINYNTVSQVNLEMYDVVVLNGNRALYIHAWKMPKGVKSIYIHHSHYKDKQSGFFKYIIRLLLIKVFVQKIRIPIRVCNSALPSFLSSRRVKTIYNGINLSKYIFSYNEKKVISDNIELLMVGSLTKNKNQSTAIDLLKLNPSFRLTIVGSGPEEKNLKNKARMLMVCDRVTWVGQQADVIKFYRKADLYLMLSKYEAMPLVVLESMAIGTPVISFSVGGIEEVIESGVDGIIINKRNVSMLAHEINFLLSDASRRHSIVIAARHKIEASFTDEIMTNKFLYLIENSQ